MICRQRRIVPDYERRLVQQRCVHPAGLARHRGVPGAHCASKEGLTFPDGHSAWSWYSACEASGRRGKSKEKMICYSEATTGGHARVTLSKMMEGGGGGDGRARKQEYGLKLNKSCSLDMGMDEEARCFSV